MFVFAPFPRSFMIAQKRCGRKVQICFFFAAKREYFARTVDFSQKVRYNRGMKSICRADSDVRKHLIIRRESANGLKPKLLYAGELRFTAHWSEQPHSHPFCELLYVTEGGGEVFADGAGYAVRQGDLVLYNAGTVHAERTEEGFSFLFFAVNNLKFSRAAEDRPLEAGASPVLSSAGYAEDFAYLFRALVREAREWRRYGDEACKGLANTILSLYLRLLSGGEEKYLSPNETYLRAKEYIDAHYLSLGRLDELCAQLFISRYYLTHLFREYSGMAPLQYALAKRFGHAKRLLEETELPVEEIAAQVGYAEPASFVRSFRVREGCTPAAYRRAKRGG